MHLDWDQAAPPEIENSWIKFQNELSNPTRIEIPRHILVFENTSLMLVGFCDASPAVYVVVVYSRTVDSSGQVHVAFFWTQSKVAPKSKISLPRLELCTATLLAKLIMHIRDNYIDRNPIDKIYALSVSMITLNWIYAPSKKWKQFISNRVSRIQDSLPSINWNFIPAKQNIFDCASRGLTLLTFVKQSGPNWLQLAPEEWPIEDVDKNPLTSREQEFLVAVITKEELPSYICLERIFL